MLVKEAATKTSDVAGDGTTTATVRWPQAVFREGLKNVTAGANPMGLKRGIEQAVEKVVTTKDKREIAQVASIAANNDKTIGNLIAELIVDIKALLGRSALPPRGGSRMKRARADSAPMVLDRRGPCQGHAPGGRARRRPPRRRRRRRPVRRVSETRRAGPTRRIG